MYDFLSIGDTQLDTVMVLNPEEVEITCQLKTDECLMCLDYASKVPVSQCYEMVAGNAANAAVTASRLDGKTGFWTMLAHDDIADRQRKYLEDENIDTTFVIKVPGAQSHRSTVISVGGERTILVYHAPRTYEFPQDLVPAKWVYLTSLAKGFESLLPDLSKYIDRTGAKLAFQPGTYQLRLGPEKTEAILKRTEVILLNVQEAEMYTGQDEGTSIVKLSLALHNFGPRIVVITDSTRGSYVSDGTTILQLGTRPEVPRVESTGAGDAFSSAFVVALYENQPIAEAMRWGTMNAESVIQKIGPQAGILTKTQLHDELRRCPEFVARVYTEDK